MADLSTLSSTDPTDGEAVSNGASRIRETRDSVKTSFDVEHALAGPHTFLYGAPGARPAAGNGGRIYFDTTNERVERDDGAAWRALHAVQLYRDYQAADLGALTVGNTHTCNTIAINLATDSKLFAFMSVAYSSASAGSAFFGLRYDGVTMNPTALYSTTTSATTYMMFVTKFDGVAGAHTITSVVTANVANGASCSSRQLFVAVG